MEEPLSRDQAFIKRLTDIILANLDNEQFGVEELILKMGMGRTTIHRKLKAYTKLSLSQFIREVRLQKAHEMLQQNIGTVSEISYKVGFGSPTYFNKCFHEYYGYPPGDVRKIESGIKALTLDKPDLLHIPENTPPETTIKPAPMWRLKHSTTLLIPFGILAGLLMIWFLYSVFFRNTDSAAGPGANNIEKSVAVLPFINLSEDLNDQYFADGVTVDIRDHLSRISGLRVISGTTSEHFRGSTLTTPEIAEKLGVSYVLEGSSRIKGNMTRVSVKLVDARLDRQLLSETFDREMSDIFSVQGEIAQKVADILEVALSATEIEQMERIPTKNVDAHVLYLKGRYFWNLRTQESLRTSIGYFERSIEADPGYALAYAGLALTYYTLALDINIPTVEGFQEAKKLAQKALEIDPSLAEAHTTLGGVLARGEWQWETARKEYLLAIKLNPNFSTLYYYYAEFLDIMGENQEARRQIDIALELDPFSRGINYKNMICYYNQGKFQEALKAWNEFNEMGLAYFNPYPYYFYIYMYLGEDSLAYNAFYNFVLTNTERLKYSDKLQEMFDKSGTTGILEWMNEQKLYELASDQKSEVSDPREYFYLAKRLAILGKNNESLYWLEKAMKEKCVYLPYIYNSWDFKNLRNEPGFRAILRKMNFPEYKSQTSVPD
jgi:TolB-like protein/AraC-like DNA-binding protein